MDSGETITEPLFLEAGLLQRRQEIMRQVDAIENTYSVCTGTPEYIKCGSNRVSYEDLRSWQHKTAYEMLRDRANPREVAARIHRPVEWVLAIREKFKLY